MPWGAIYGRELNVKEMTIIIILSSQHAVREYSALYYQYMLSYSKHWHISQCNVYVIRQKKSLFWLRENCQSFLVAWWWNQRRRACLFSLRSFWKLAHHKSETPFALWLSRGPKPVVFLIVLLWFSLLGQIESTDEEDEDSMCLLALTEWYVVHVTSPQASSKPKCWEAGSKCRIERIDHVISLSSDGA